VARLAELAAAGFVEHFGERAAAAGSERSEALRERAPDFDAADSEAVEQVDNPLARAAPERPVPVEEHWQPAAAHSMATAAAREAVHCRLAAGQPLQRAPSRRTHPGLQYRSCQERV